MQDAIDNINQQLLQRETAERSTAHSGAKYLTFLLADEDYGLDILKVREIIGVLDITKVPQTSDFVGGLINLRGRVIPVIDLRTRFEMPAVPFNDETCIIVVDVGELIGIIVDTVHEVHEIPNSEIEPPPVLGGMVDMSYILGMGKVDGKVKILLDIDKVLNSKDLVNCTVNESKLVAETV
ncbi:MAG: chemotaxis protein CheW [Phycisphaerae bacterium]|nr:purine-binding chemotaxis protein CheW [Phycisphaerales bacterium]